MQLDNTPSFSQIGAYLKLETKKELYMATAIVNLVTKILTTEHESELATGYRPGDKSITYTYSQLSSCRVF